MLKALDSVHTFFGGEERRRQNRRDIEHIRVLWAALRCFPLKSHWFPNPVNSGGRPNFRILC